MQLTHTLGAGGPDLELLILAAAMLVLAVVFFFQRSVKPIVGFVLVLGSFALVAGAFAAGGDDEPDTEPVASAASITISSPPDGSEVTAGEPISLEIDLEGGTISSETESDDPNVGHLHVFVDGALDSMPSSATPQVTLEPGEHEIVVEFTQASHASFEPRVLDRIQLVAR